MTSVVSDHIYDDFSRLLFLHVHREASALVNELPEESDQFRFLLTVSLPNLKGQWGNTGVDFGETFVHEDFYTARFVILVFYTTTEFHSF